MKKNYSRTLAAMLPILLGASLLRAQDSNGLAPEVADLNAAAISYALEAQLPDLPQPYTSSSPQALDDGLTVGVLGRDGGNPSAVLTFAREVAAGQHGDIDSLLIAYRGKLIFESYYRRGRLNYPHYQMSITKSYTAMAIGRAIQLGFLTVADLDRPAIDFLKHLDRSKLAPGTAAITLAEAMNMRSGIRLTEFRSRRVAEELRRPQGAGARCRPTLNSAPIPNPPREYKYQASDPALAMQILDAVVPGGARRFIETELFGKLGITNFSWGTDVSGLPKSAGAAAYVRAICSNGNARAERWRVER
jgi:CubicO group peptidase (beta-lactamase class C family)